MRQFQNWHQHFCSSEARSVPLWLSNRQMDSADQQFQSQASSSQCLTLMLSLVAFRCLPFSTNPDIGVSWNRVVVTKCSTQSSKFCFSMWEVHFYAHKHSFYIGTSRHLLLWDMHRSNKKTASAFYYLKDLTSNTFLYWANYRSSFSCSISSGSVT